MAPKGTVRTQVADIEPGSHGDNENALARLRNPAGRIQHDRADAITEGDECVVNLEIVASSVQRKKSRNVLGDGYGRTFGHLPHHADPLAEQSATGSGEPLGLARERKVLAGKRTP